MRELAKFLIALWLIVKGTLSLTNIHIPYIDIILPSVAIIAGVAILIHLLKFKIADIGLLLLSFWLVLHGSVLLFNFQFPYQQITVAILAIACGFFLLIRI